MHCSVLHGCPVVPRTRSGTPYCETASAGARVGGEHSPSGWRLNALDRAAERVLAHAVDEPHGGGVRRPRRPATAVHGVQWHRVPSGHGVQCDRVRGYASGPRAALGDEFAAGRTGAVPPPPQTPLPQ
jgi:hypothetical protein